MTYVLLSLTLVTVAAFLAFVLRGFLQVRVTLVSGIVLSVMTAVFDNLIIAAGIVAYDDSQISGLLIGLAPIEDFSYTIAGVLFLPALWNWLRVKL